MVYKNKSWLMSIAIATLLIISFGSLAMCKEEGVVGEELLTES